jgi:hypothetical protein
MKPTSWCYPYAQQLLNSLVVSCLPVLEVCDMKWDRLWRDVNQLTPLNQLHLIRHRFGPYAHHSANSASSDRR